MSLLLYAIYLFIYLLKEFYFDLSLVPIVMFNEKFRFMICALEITLDLLLHLVQLLAWLDLFTHILVSDFLKNNLDCTSALGMQNGAIPDIRVTASSIRNLYTRASLARLNLTGQGNYSGGWVAGVLSVVEHLQIVFDTTDTVLTAIATQGREDADQWVKKYYLKYKNSNWRNYKDQQGIIYTVSMIYTSFFERYNSLKWQRCVNASRKSHMFFVSPPEGWSRLKFERVIYYSLKT